MTAWILWLAMGMSQLGFLLLSLVIVPTAADPSLGPVLILPALPAVAVSVAAPLLPPFAKLAPQTRYIVRWALAESAGIMGLVSWMMSGTHTWQLVAAGLGLAAWAVAVPKGEAWIPQHRD